MKKSAIFGTDKPPSADYQASVLAIKDPAAKAAIRSIGQAFNALIVVLQRYVSDSRVAGSTGIPTPINTDRVGLSNTSAHSVANNTQVPLTWDTEEYDPSDLHGGAFTHLVTIKNPGQYIMIGQITYRTDLAGVGPNLLTEALIRLNGTKIAQGQTPTDGTFATTVEVVTMKPLVAGDYVELVAFHQTGATLATAPTFKSTGFSVARIA